MRYCTRDLLGRFQSEDDDIADAAQEEWDRKSEEYRQHLSLMEQSLNHVPQFRRLLNEYRLQGAQVVRGGTNDGFVSRVGDKRFYSIELRPEASPEAPLLLIYHLAPGQEPPDVPLGCYWLYDEVDVVGTSPLTFSHAILFSDGTELEVRFVGFELQTRPDLIGSRG